MSSARSVGSRWAPRCRTQPSGFPWATFVVNVTGAFAMGLLVAYLVDRPGAHRLARPFVGVGVLGGWTTFSARAVDVVQLGHADQAQRHSSTWRRPSSSAPSPCRRVALGQQSGPAMTLTNALLVALGAAVGAPLRYLVNHGIRVRFGAPPPPAPWSVNVVGRSCSASSSGPVSAPPQPGRHRVPARSPPSPTLALEIWDAMDDDRYPHAVANVTLSLVLGLGAAWLGWALAS